MRGKARVCFSCFVADGITPAYAGKSSSRSQGVDTGKDHPRVCGEKITRRPVPRTPPGSPPRMRGKVSMISAFTASFRITPAYAGKSNLHFSNKTLCKDHPRVCGEKLESSYSRRPPLGSPPRMRGKGVVVYILCTFTRITPAYAGKSSG